MIGVILLISDLLYGKTRPPAIATTAIGGLFAIVWYIVPLTRRVRD